MTGGPVKSVSRSILQTWLLVVVLADWKAAWHRWNPVTATVWLICWFSDECPASSPFRILNNLKGQITPQVGAPPTGSRWCFECCWWVSLPWIQSEDKCRWRLLWGEKNTGNLDNCCLFELICCLSESWRQMEEITKAGNAWIEASAWWRDVSHLRGFYDKHGATFLFLQSKHITFHITH